MGQEMERRQLKERVSFWQQFLQEGVWMLEPERLRPMRRLLVQALKVLVTAGRGYVHDGCGVQASALTYITLVSLVPMLAIMFSFSKGIGFQSHLFDAVGIERVELVAGEVSYRVKEVVAGVQPGMVSELPESMQRVVLQIFTYVENTNFAAMGVVGTVMLFVSVVLSIAKLERCFNLIWGVDRPRPLLKKFAEYLVVLLVAPLLFLLVGSVNSLLMSESVMGVVREYAGPVAGLMVWFAKLVMLCLLFVFFAFFYMFMPHTRVKAGAALLSGAVTGLLWFAVLLAYLKLQIGLSNFNTIYGTFAALPFFLAVLYANWCIVLAGGELSYALQYHRFLRVDKHERPMPAGACMLLGQLAMYEACRAYATPGEGSWAPERYAIRHAIPLRQMQHAVLTLVQARLLVKLDVGEDEDRFVPGCPSESITPATVEQVFRDIHSADGRQYFSLLPPRLAEALRGCVAGFDGDLSRLRFTDYIESESAAPRPDAEARA